MSLECYSGIFIISLKNILSRSLIFLNHQVFLYITVKQFETESAFSKASCLYCNDSEIDLMAESLFSFRLCQVCLQLRFTINSSEGFQGFCERVCNGICLQLQNMTDLYLEKVQAFLICRFCMTLICLRSLNIQSCSLKLHFRAGRSSPYNIPFISFFRQNQHKNV